MRVGVLKCDTADPVIIQELGDYDQIVQRFLHLADPNIQIKTYDCQTQQYPDNIDEVQAYLITGSRYSTYQTQSQPWIQTLSDFIQHLDQKKKKLIGICFGHQLIAQTLGGRVQPNPQGWEISVTQVQLTPLAAQFFERSILLMHQMHQDIVTQLPPDTVNLGYTDNTPIQGMTKGNHILTCQFHPEYLPPITRNLILRRLHRIPKKVVEQGLQALFLPTDERLVAKKIVEFINAG